MKDYPSPGRRVKKTLTSPWEEDGEKTVIARYARLPGREEMSFTPAGRRRKTRDMSPWGARQASVASDHSLFSILLPGGSKSFLHSPTRGKVQLFFSPFPGEG